MECAVLAAVKSGDLPKVKRLIAKGCPANAKNETGMTPVLVAAREGHNSIIELLVNQYHYSLTDIDNVGRNALHLAAEGGHGGTIQYLAPKMNSLLHKTDVFGDTMVHCAALSGHADVVQLVIDKLHLDPTARNKTGVTPMLRAAFKGHNSIIELLVDQYHCSLTDVDDDGYNALHFAAYGGQVDTIEYLAPKMDSLLHKADNFGDTMLHCAARNGHVDVVRLLIDELHFNPTACNKEGRTPALLASSNGHSDLMDVLVRQYGCSKSETKGLKHAFLAAAKKGNLDTVKDLIGQGCPVNTRDQDGMNALHLAAMGGHVKTLQYLAPKMASLLHSTDHQGFTMLHWAAERGQAEVARVLLEEYKLDPTTHDKQSMAPGVPTSESGETPLHKAVKCNHRRVAQLLIQNGALAAIKDPGPLEKAITHGDLSTAKKLLQTPESETKSNTESETETESESKIESEPDISPTWRSDYEEAVKKQGSVKVTINRCIFAGPPGKGKSCLKHLLVHDKPKEVKTSTGVMEKPDVVTISAEKCAVEGTSVWLPLTDDKMASSIKSSCQNHEYHISEDDPEDRHDKLAHIIKIIPPVVAGKATSHSFNADPDPSDTKSNSLHLQPSANTADVSAFHQAHFRLMSDPSLGEGLQLNGARFVHLLDTGGQPSFQAVLPLLLDVPCTYVLVFNAAEGLNAPVPITYRPNDTTVVKSGSRPETAWTMMLRSLSSVYTLVHKVSSDVRALLVDNHLPPLRTVIVGTFADELKQMGNIATATKEIGKQIKQLENKPYYSSLIPNLDGQLFHLVNNLPHRKASKRTPGEQASINNLREVLSHPDGALNAKIPIGWYQFEMVSRMVDQKFFKFSELLDHARELKCITSADPSQFHSLLQLFHSLGVFTFIDREDVSHMVCTDSSVFLQVVSKLLAVEFKIPKCIAVRTFKETGILSLDRSLFNELGISKEVDPVWLLRCLCYLGVAACLSLPNTGTLEYFIPAALPSEDKGNVSEHGSVAPLMVAFQYKANAFLSMEDLPHGIFARLAVELANKGWKVVRKKNTRLVIRFQWKGLDISIVESAGCIRIIPIVSIHAKCSVAELHELCIAVQFTVEAAIHASAQAVFGSKFTEKAKPIFAFECPCKVFPSHFAVPSANTLVCDLSSQRLKYSKDQRVWFYPIEGAQLQPHSSDSEMLQLVDPTSERLGGIFKKGGILSEKVSDRHDQLMLFRTYVSRKAAGKGRAVLEGVGLCTATIDACFCNHPLDEEGAVQAGLVKWSDGQGLKPPTWQVLLEAMMFAQIAQQHVQGLKKTLGMHVQEHCPKPLPVQVTYDHVFKILIIGDSGVGKSSLLMQFSDNLLSNTPTIGIDIKNCTVDVKGAKVKLKIWDTAGQERFRTITSMHYRGTHGVIFVYDVTNADTFRSIKKWLHEIDQSCDRVSRVLVGNKDDDHKKKVVPLEVAQQFADQIGIPLYETSAKKGKNVEEVFHAIARLVLKQKLETEPHKAASAGDRIVLQTGGKRESGGGRKKRSCC